MFVYTCHTFLSEERCYTKSLKGCYTWIGFWFAHMTMEIMFRSGKHTSLLTLALNQIFFVIEKHCKKTCSARGCNIKLCSFPWYARVFVYTYQMFLSDERSYTKSLKGCYTWIDFCLAHLARCLSMKNTLAY
jgi:hypothetical protein